MATESKAPLHRELQGGRFAARGGLVPAVFLLCFAAQCAWFIRSQSLTYDEPVHIAEGLDAWRNGRFEQYNDHPPLARLLCTLPLMSSKWQVQVDQLPHSFEVHRIDPYPVSMAWRARAPNVVLGLLLGILIWLEVARLFSRTAANFALALFAFSPSLIAHFSLATTDGAATLLIFAVAICIAHCGPGASWRTQLLLGILLGLLLLSKYSTLPVFALSVGLLLVLTKSGPELPPGRWQWKPTVVAFVMALFVVWAGYFFHVSRLTIREHVLTVTHPNWTSVLVKPAHQSFNISVPVPAGEYIAGLRDLAFHNAHGQPAFFLGEVSPKGGWKLYYPLAILLKWPLIVLISSICGLVLCVKRRATLPRALWVTLTFPALYFTLAVFAHFNIGERHVLPLYPFALLLAGAASEEFRNKRWGASLVWALVLLNAADVLRYAPGYLSYFEIFVPPNSSHRLLTDSNLDWGQGLIAVRKYATEHPREQISLAYFGSVDPKLYGIAAQPLPENTRASGTVIVGATEISGQYLHNPDGYKWLLEHRPTAVLDHCMYVYVVDR